MAECREKVGYQGFGREGEIICWVHSFCLGDEKVLKIQNDDGYTTPV